MDRHVAVAALAAALTDCNREEPAPLPSNAEQLAKAPETTVAAWTDAQAGLS